MIAMFRAVLYTQWKWSRLIVVLGTVAAFAIPLLSLQGAARADRGALQTQDLLRAVQSWGTLYPLLATALIGSSLAVLTATLPPGLQAYPIALAVRFAFAVFVAYAVFFAVSAGTARTAGIILGVIAAVVLVQVVANIVNIDLNLCGAAQTGLLLGPGPLAVFTGRWMLVDV